MALMRAKGKPAASKAEPSKMLFRKFVRITKIDEMKREVGGVVTAEQPDKAKEVCDYESTVPFYKAWSDELSKATGGKNVGNLREMHQLKAVGAGKTIEFNDVDKEIYMTFKVVNDDAWTNCLEGVYTGFSHGGEYVKTWKGNDGLVHYTANPAEVSLVDNPCLPKGHFDFVRADGVVEKRAFKKQGCGDCKYDPEKGCPCKAEAVAGFPSRGFFKWVNLATLECACSTCGRLIKAKKKIQAVIGHLKGETTTTVQSIIFSPKSEWTASDCQQWLKDHDLKAPEADETEDSYRFRQRDPGDFEEDSFRTINFKGGKKKTMAFAQMSKAQRDVVKAELHKAALAILEAKAEEMGVDLKKDMYDVERLAEILQQLAYIRMSAQWERENEGDESELPDLIQKDLESLAETFLSMAEEEVGELTTSAKKAASIGGGKMATMSAVQKAASALDHIKKMHAAHKAFHAKMHKAHQDREAEMDDHMDKLHKILGTGETAPASSGNEPVSTDPAASGASSTIKTMETTILAKLDEMAKGIDDKIKTGIDTAIGTMLEGMLGEKGVERALQTAGQNRKAAASAGIGDRNDLAEGGPKTHLAVKANDTSVAGLQAHNANAEVPKANMEKAAQGDTSEILKAMSGVKPAEDVSDFARGPLSKFAPK